MSSIKYMFNITGCIEKYADLKTARTWLVMATRELPADQFLELVKSVYRWSRDDLPN